MLMESLILDLWVTKSTTQNKNPQMMDIGSSFKIGLNVQSNVEEEHQHFKDNVSHLRVTENLVMEMKF